MTYKNQIIVSGAGGGGKGGGAGSGAVEAPNSLRSKQVAHIIDLLGEGEWEGLIDGPAGIYFNGVALFTPTAPTGDVIDLDLISDDGTWAPEGSWNFKGVSVEFRHGTQSQAAIRSASSASSIDSVNLPVIHATPVVAAVSSSTVDMVVVSIQVDQLYQQDTTNGNISGYFVDLEIQVRHDGGAWASIRTDRIEGKAMSPYVREYAIDLHAIDADGPWDVRVIRTSEDDPDSSKHSTITFLGLTLMTRDKFRYPNSVLCSIGIDASQLNSIPTRAYDCKMLRIRVPSNYNPVTRAYTGVWDGTFTTAWSDNPAWCLYDMITSSRYGLGDYVDEELTDKWALYTIGQYCDELVPDGFGGTEPRFTLNVYFQTPAEAINLVQNLASAFRGILYYLNESLTALQDSPSDAVYQFNSSNVENGEFKYGGASGSTRHTVAMVVWNNPEIDYKQDIEIVEDPAGLLRFGYRPVTVQALGCTSRGQAHRLGLWTLYVEQYEADLVTFATALEGTGVQPGNIIDIYDPTRAAIRLGGRVLSIAGQTITIDKPVAVMAGTHTVTFVADDGTLVTRDATMTTGTHSTITMDGSGAVPSISSIFGLQTADVMAQQFRIISITESDAHKYEITAVAYNVSKYDYIENNLALQIRPIRADITPESTPSGVTFTETLYLLADGSVCNRLTVSWDQNPWALEYALSYKIGSNNWTAEVRLPSNSFVIDSVVENWTYSFRINVLSMNDVRGAQTEISYVVLGVKAPPPPFDFLDCVVAADGTREITYGYDVTPIPLDYLGAQIRYLLGTTTDWDAMTPVGGDTGFFTYSPIETGQVPEGTYTLAAKAVDKTQVLSDPLFVEVVIGPGRTGVDTIDEARARIDAMSSDDVLSMGEKRDNHLMFLQIIAFHDSRVAQGTAAGLTTEVSDFEDAYDELATYLTTAYDSMTGYGVGLGGTDWSNPLTDSIIDGSVFRAKFTAVFDTAQILDTRLHKLSLDTANTAVASIAEADARIDDISDDNILSMGEKRSNQILWNQIIAFHDSRVAQATAIGVGSELTDFTTAYSALETYLTAVYNAGTHQGVGTGGTDWSDATTNSIIHGPTFRAKFQDVFDTAQVLDTLLFARAQSTADTAYATLVDYLASANSAVVDTASDNVLTGAEKPRVALLRSDILAWQSALAARLTAYTTATGLTAPSRTTFDTAVTALGTYLTAVYNSGTGQGVGTGTADWSNTATNSTISSTVFVSKFRAVYDAAAALDIALASTSTSSDILTTVAPTVAAVNSASVALFNYISEANTAIAATATDNVLQKEEKTRIQLAYNDIIDWQSALAARLTAYATATGLSAPSRTAFDATVTALTTYLTAVYNGGTGQGVGTGTTDWSNTATDSTILGTTFRAKFRAVYDAGYQLDLTLGGYTSGSDTLSAQRMLGESLSATQIQLTEVDVSNATKLSKSSADILTGVTSVSSSGGLKTGTITWNSSGVLTGGTGVAVTSNGIVAAASGTATFTLNATTGAATFKGAISGGATLDITGSAKFGGTTSTSDGDAAVAANTSGVADFGVIGYSGSGSTGGGLMGINLYNNGYGLIGYGLSQTTDTGPSYNGGTNVVKSTGVRGELLALPQALGTHHSGQGVWGYNGTNGTSAYGVRATGGFYLESGILKWGSYTFAEPTGSTTKFARNDGSWSDLTSLIKHVSTGGVPGGAITGSIVVDTYGGAGQVRLATYAV